MAIPFSTVASCRENTQVKIVGVVKPIQTLIAPLSRRPCIAYWIELKLGQTTYRRFAVMPFVIADETGSALVDIRNSLPELGLATQSFAGGSIFKMLHVAQYPGLAELGFQKAEATVERILEPDERAVVYGYALHDPVPAGVGYRVGSRGQVRLVPPQKGIWAVNALIPGPTRQGGAG